MLIGTSLLNNKITDYTYGNDFYDYFNYLESCLNDVDSSYIDYQIAENLVMTESTVMGEVNQEKTIYLEATQKSLIEKIGAAIIEMGKKFAEMINKCIEKLKDLTFKFKNNEKKMNILLKEHPELAKEKIQILCDNGGLDFSDMKSISEMNRTFNEIVKMSKDKDVDGNTLKGKWKKAMDKIYGPNDSTLDKVSKTIGVTAAAVTLGITLKTAVSKIAKSKSELDRIKSEDRKMSEDIYRRLRDEGIINDNTGKATALLYINRERQGKIANICKENMSVIDKAQEKIANILDKASNMKAVSKIAGNQKANFHNNMKNADSVRDYNMDQTIKNDIKKDKLKEKLTPDKTDEELIREIKNKHRKDELEEKIIPKKTLDMDKIVSDELDKMKEKEIRNITNYAYKKTTPKQDRDKNDRAFDSRLADRLAPDVYNTIIKKEYNKRR